MDIRRQNFIYSLGILKGLKMKAAQFLSTAVKIMLVGALAGSAHVALAEVSVCAAVTPCGLDGEVLPEFATGDCADTYAAECSAIAFSSPQSAEKVKMAKVRKQVTQCVNNSRRLEWRLQRRIAGLQAQLKEAQQAALLKN